MLDSVSMTSIVLTYPANSSLSKTLNGYNSSVSLSGSFTGNSNTVVMFQGHFDDEDSHSSVKSSVTIDNMSVSYSLKARGNATALVVNKETDIRASVTGVFTIVNGTVHANLGWRSFSIPGAMTLNLENHEVDINLVGSAMTEQLGDHPIAVGQLLGMFGAYGLWHRPTLNFSSLNAPLTTWTRNYDSLTNTTTFSKTISGMSSLLVSADYNGQKYTLSVTADPSASIATEGYATATGDSLVLGSAPAYLSPVVWVAGGIVVVAAIAGVFYGMGRSRSRTSQPKVSNFPSAAK